MLGLEEFTLSKISTVVGIDVTIVGTWPGAQAVVLITKYPASFSHSMASPQCAVDVTGGLEVRRESALGRAVAVGDVDTVWAVNSLLPSSMRTVPVFSEAAVAV